MKTREVTVLSDAFLRLVRIFRYRKINILIGTEFLLLIVLYGIFMFSDQVPLLGLIVLGILWAVRWWTTGKLSVTTPVDIPVLGILALLPISLYASTDWSLSLPKVYGIILGIAIFYAIVNAIDNVQRLELAIIGLILLGISVALLGLLGTDWTVPKLFFLPSIYGVLPRLIREVPRSISGGGIQANIVGGAITFFIPFLASLLWNSSNFKIIGLASNNIQFGGALRAWYKPILLFSLALTSLTLILTQSRGAFFGVVVGLYVLALWHDRRFLWVILLAALGFFVMVQVWGVGNPAEFMSRMDVTGGITLPGRMELWQRAIYMIQDFPFTGVGIGTFDPVAHVLYPFFLFGPDVQVPHAHNMLLEVAVDLGIPGLVFYAALLSGFAFSAWRAYQVAARSLRALILGLACGMLAHQIFGLTDAFMLGTKLGMIMWVFIGLVTALYLRRQQLTQEFMEGLAGEKGGRSVSLQASKSETTRSAKKNGVKPSNVRSCPYCQSTSRQNKAGKIGAGSQRYRCMNCNRRYTPKHLKKGNLKNLRIQSVVMSVDRNNLNYFAHATQYLRQLGRFFSPLAYWALFSLLAISLVGNQPYLGLAIALLGGGILGYICTESIESKNQ